MLQYKEPRAFQTPSMVKSKTMMKVLYDFGQNTSILGVSNAAKAKSKTRATIWMIIFLAFGYGTIRGIYQTVKLYLDYPVITQTEITFKPQVQYHLHLT